MSEQQDPMESYVEQIAQHELAKQEGVAAYADAIIELLPDMDEDKAILIKEGLKAMLGGPPAFMPSMLEMPPPAEIDAEFVPPPSPYFTETDENGITTVYDWMAISGEATHIHRHPDQSLQVMRGPENIIFLKGEAAAKLWEWQQTYIKNFDRSMSGQPVMVGRMRR